MNIPTNATLQKIERSSQGRSSRYGEPEYVVDDIDIPVRLELRQRNEIDADGNTVWVDADLVIPADTRVLAEDRMTFQEEEEVQYRVLRVMNDYAVNGEIEKVSCTLARVRRQ